MVAVSGDINFLPPNRPLYPDITEGLVNMHLTKMSSEIFQDASIKMRSVKSYAEVHQDNPQFVIGTIVVNIYGLFDKMAQVYQKSCSLRNTRHKGDWDSQYIVVGVIESVSAVQGLFHQLRLEKKLFDEVIEEKAAEARKKKEMNLKKYGHLMKGDEATIAAPPKKKGGMFEDRRFNVAPLFNEHDFDSNFELPILSKRKHNQNKANQRTPYTPEDTHVPSNPYVPLPLEGQVPEFDQKMDISKMLPRNFRPLPANSSIMKIIEQLKIDNPGLNPDLDAYTRNPINRRGNRLTLSESANRPYRRMGSDSQVRKGSNSSVQRLTNPDIYSTLWPKSRYENDHVPQPSRKPDSDPSLRMPKLDLNRHTSAGPLKLLPGDKITANLNGRRSLNKHKQQPKLEFSRYMSDSTKLAGNHTLSSKLASETRGITSGISSQKIHYQPLTPHNVNSGRRFFNNERRKKKKRSPIWKPKEIY